MTSAGELTSCVYCHLPLPPQWSKRRAADPVRYCCYGCRFAAAVAGEPGEQGQARWTLVRLGLSVFFTMNVMVFTLALWTQDVYVHQESVQSEQAAALYEVFRYLGLLFAAPVLLLLGVPLAESAASDIRGGRVTTDLLLLLGVSAAFTYSAVSVAAGEGHVYFEVVCMVLVAVTLGKWLEATGKLKTTEVLRSLENLLPETVRVVEVHGETSSETRIPLHDVAVGQLVRVLPGERIAVDGRIQHNRASIDQQLVTGESRPAVKDVGDDVFAGTLNLDGDLYLRVTGAPGAGTLSRMVQVLTQAAATKGREQRLADRLARWFVPAVILIAIGTFTLRAASGEWHEALMSSLAVALIACPCALGIATPMAVWVALGHAARGQVLFRDGDAISRMAGVRALCFDKTGTLTSGEERVAAFETDGRTPRALVLETAVALAACSRHSLSLAIQRWVGTENRLPLAREPRAVAGRGVVAEFPQQGAACLGNPRFMAESGLELGDDLANAVAAARQRGRPVACVGWQGSVRGVFEFREQLRNEAPSTLDQLRQQGYYVSVLTGDDAARSEALGETLNVEVQSELLPSGKIAAIERIRSEHGPVAMVGDGLNDAPALASADVGIALGCGADLSRDAADVCLLSSDLRRLPWALELAAKTRRTVRQNLFWALAYNVIGIGLAITGLLNPIVAAIAMVASSLLVVTNSLRTGRAGGKLPEEPQPAASPRLAALEFGGHTE